jgi:hypothetical protein
MATVEMAAVIAAPTWFSFRAVAHVSARHLPRTPLLAQAVTSDSVMSMNNIRKLYQYSFEILRDRNKRLGRCQLHE